MATKQCMICGVTLDNQTVDNITLLYGEFSDHLDRIHGITLAEYQDMEARQPRRDPYEHRPSQSLDAPRKRL